MASDHSFDIVSKVDPQEITNAINQTEKELANRFDLKDAKTEIDFNPTEFQIVIASQDAFKVKAVYEILGQKLIKRNISTKALSAGEIKSALGGTARQEITLQNGIPKDQAKLLIKDIKDSGFKVQTQIQEDQVRVTAKKIDDLQAIMKLLQGKEYPFHLQFMNYR